MPFQDCNVVRGGTQGESSVSQSVASGLRAAQSLTRARCNWLATWLLHLPSAPPSPSVPFPGLAGMSK